MTNKEIHKMCIKLAKRYNDKNYFDDLVSEGVLACLELIAEGKDADLHNTARRAMSDFMQIKTLAVTVPINGTTRRPDFKFQFNGTSDVEEHMAQIEDCYISIETRDLLRKLQVELTEVQWETVKLLYKYNNDVKVVADEMGRTRQAVEKSIKAVRDKILFLS